MRCFFQLTDRTDFFNTSFDCMLKPPIPKIH